MNINNIGIILGEMGCKFRSNIEEHIKDYNLVKQDDVEWLLEPLTEISHPDNQVIDAYIISTPWEFIYKLYYHYKNASAIYIPFDKGYKEPCATRREGNTIRFLNVDEMEEAPKPKPFDKSMIIKDDLNPRASEAIPSIWDELTVPFTTVGIWQAALLNEITAMFPKGWHANYLEKIYVFSKADMQQIVDQGKTPYNNLSDAEIERYKAYVRSIGRIPYINEFRLSDYLDRDDIMPSVEIDGDKAVASFFYWNDWRGFCREIIPVEKHGESVKFGKYDREVLVKYDCGLRF